MIPRVFDVILDKPISVDFLWDTLQVHEKRYNIFPANWCCWFFSRQDFFDLRNFCRDDIDFAVSMIRYRFAPVVAFCNIPFIMIDSLMPGHLRLVRKAPFTHFKKLHCKSHCFKRLEDEDRFICDMLFDNGVAYCKWGQFLIDPIELPEDCPYLLENLIVDQELNILDYQI